MAAIGVEHVSKAFGSQLAVRDLSLDVLDGELLVLLGPSGCGKTTTLNCIAGLEAPSSGRITFDGQDLTPLPPHQRNVAMVFQSSILYPHLTARHNIAMSLKRSRLSRREIEHRISGVAEILEIRAFLDKVPSQLSGGERQRVATAKAIVRQPAAFLMDEPLAALDAGLRLTLRSEMVNLQKRLKTTMIFVTHDQIEAMTMGDRIAVMRDGRIEQIGTPDEIYNQPQNLFVAGFIGSPPMNFFEGEVREGDNRLNFVSETMVARLPDRYRNLVGRQFVLGVRPQHIEVGAEARAGALPATVFALERLGKESIIILEPDGSDKVRAIVGPEFTTRVGERLFIAPAAAQGLLFDTSDGRLAAAG